MTTINPEARKTVKERALSVVLSIVGTVLAILLPIMAWKSSIEDRIAENAKIALQNATRIEVILDDRKTNGIEVLSELKQLRTEVSQMQVG
jgi:hypothetical protein